MASLATASEIYELVFPDRENPPPTYISHGLPFAESCAKHVSGTFGAQRAYIMASTSLAKQTSHVSDLEQALGHRHVGTWTGLRPHTFFDELVPIVNDMREKKADLIITIGGSSLTDGAKIIMYAIANDVHTLSDMEALLVPTAADLQAAGRHFRDKTNIGTAPSIPLICIPTTLSASEYTRFGGGTSSTTHLKTILTHPEMFPRLVILAPELALTTPDWVWLSTGVRAIDHCVESFCHPSCPPDVRLASSHALGILVPALLKSQSNPTDLDARLNCHLAAKEATTMLLHMPNMLLAGASHGIGHQLGPLGIGHGETSCILLPAVLKYNAAVNSSEQALLNAELWKPSAQLRALFTSHGLSETESDLSVALDVVFRALGMPRSLAEKQVFLSESQKMKLAENALRDPCCVVNPIPLTETSQVLEILGMIEN